MKLRIFAIRTTYYRLLMASEFADSDRCGGRRTGQQISLSSFVAGLISAVLSSPSLFRTCTAMAGRRFLCRFYQAKGSLNRG